MERLAISLSMQGEVDKYPAKEHARRVAHKLGQQAGVIVLNGTQSAYYSHSDNPIHFRQDRYFYYLSGCDEPNCVLTYDIAKDYLTLYLPEVVWRRFYYDGRGSTIKEAEQMYDIDEAKFIPAEAEVGAEWVIGSLSEDRLFFLEAERSHISAQALDKKRPDFDYLQPAADTCRAVKDEHEIELIRKANEITAAAHKDILLNLHKCKTEAEVEAIYLKRCIASLAPVQAYEPIVAAGENASYLHYVRDDKAFGDSQVLVVDAGCEWKRYASDVTRTIPLNRKKPGHWPSKEAENVYKAVERIQEVCISYMGVANRFSSVQQKARDMCIEELLKLGILKGDHEEILEVGTWRAFYPHGLGHHLGLEVHDVMPPAAESQTTSDDDIPEWPMPHQHHRPRQTRRMSTAEEEPYMERGNVITIEPGIYFNKVVLDKFFLHDEKHKKFIDKDVLKRYMPVGGVRIEDDILITDFGGECLTTAPKGEEMLELLREAAKHDVVAD